MTHSLSLLWDEQATMVFLIFSIYEFFWVILQVNSIGLEGAQVL